MRDIDLEVPAGTTLALVGETGSGKTTLAYLLARLYDVEEGRVAIDGIDVRDLTHASLASVVGVVSQETHLFHASIADNLRFAKPGATDAELEQAARAAQIHDLIERLPDGYETVVGERGYRFSGGEKQRIAIARTILRDPPILVLDEATSALDTETERAVQAALDELARGPHDRGDRAPAVDRARRAPDRGAGPRPRGGARRPRRADRGGRTLRCDDRGPGWRAGDCLKTTIEEIVEVEIERPPSEVWAFINDTARLPEWIAEFASARDEPDSPTGVGSVVHYTLKQGNRSGTFEIVEWDPPRRTAWDGPPLRAMGGGLRPRGSHELTAAGEGRTLLVSHYRPEVSGLQVLLRPYLKRWVRRERRASARALKALVEAAARS